MDSAQQFQFTCALPSADCCSVFNSDGVPCFGALGRLQIHCVKELSIFQTQSAAGRQKLLNVVLQQNKNNSVSVCIITQCISLVNHR